MHLWHVATSSDGSETVIGWSGHMPFDPTGYVSGGIATGLNIVANTPTWIPPTVR